MMRGLSYERNYMVKGLYGQVMRENYMLRGLHGDEIKLWGDYMMRGLHVEGTT